MPELEEDTKIQPLTWLDEIEKLGEYEAQIKRIKLNLYLSTTGWLVLGVCGSVAFFFHNFGYMAITLFASAILLLWAGVFISWRKSIQINDKLTILVSDLERELRYFIN